MLAIENYSNDNKDKIISFLSSVPSISSLDEKILVNSSVITENLKVIGSMSFEEFDKNGLIRYFVFKRSIPNELLVNMLNNVIDTAKNKNINRLVCIVDNEQIRSLFLELGFNDIEENVYINEEKSINTLYSNSTFLSKVI